jgi:hypothetical protein
VLEDSPADPLRDLRDERVPEASKSVDAVRDTPAKWWRLWHTTHSVSKFAGSLFVMFSSR